MKQTTTRWSVYLLALFLLGPVAGLLVASLRAPDGGHDATLLVNTTPVMGVIKGLLAIANDLSDHFTVIEVAGPEVPIMDGSSEPFVFLVECAGVVEQKKPRRVIRILKPVSVTDGDCSAELRPSERFSVDMHIDFDSAAINQQRILLRVVNGAFCKELARARTFGFLHEVEAMQSAGLAKGGSLENAIVVSGDRILNEDGLRFDDEFVRHKALDAVGDMYLAGHQIVGSFVGHRSGHALNNKLLRALFADPEAWTYGELTNADEELVPGGAIVGHGDDERIAIPA